MSNVLGRGLRLLELLSLHADGLPLHVLADTLRIPRSATHRLLTELVQNGYVRQAHSSGPYLLTIRLISLGLTYLARNGIPSIAQPIVDRLATRNSVLCRLAIVSGRKLIWVAKCQGARDGLRYDPDDGATAHLSSTANGHAWLSTMTDEEAMTLVSLQGFGDPERLGRNAPMTMQALLERLHLARARGYAVMTDGFTPGTAAIAMVVRQPDSQEPLGVLSLAGPLVRLDEARMHGLASELRQAVQEMGEASRGARFLADHRMESTVRIDTAA
ncbi:IclR family transcriptional regulator (plasmid) [Roseomonas sp. FDAARGOS_362]|uniref:IclR family transcriptional regulator n=1 Tax=Roseomonas TaxID=125216 RepID=UPI000C18086A|nr:MULTISPECIES: IclR family transcriptional regulator [Roseomonas]ATR19497.1 IclR family transcriptional regulator [Roseomonas sp. FDAARGOS_362]MDT8351874.1 IclR family transcriptional regulator [Roseomonas mucosa]